MAIFRRTTGPRSPDYSAVRSVEDVEQAVTSGALEAVLLLPHECGGAAIAENTVYVPPGFFEQERNAFLRIAADGLRDGFEYSAVPSYEADSRVPVRVLLEATADDGRVLRADLTIWGKSLDDARH